MPAYDPCNTADYETPNLDWNAEFRNAESRFSQLLYHGQTLVLQKLTESKFGIPKFGIPIEILSLMSPGIGWASLFGLWSCVFPDRRKDPRVVFLSHWGAEEEV